MSIKEFTCQNDSFDFLNRQGTLGIPFIVLLYRQKKYPFGIMDPDGQSLHARRKLLPGCGQRGEASQGRC